MARDFPLFLDIIRNVEMALAKADFSIARLYAAWSQTRPCATASSPPCTPSSNSPAAWSSPSPANPRCSKRTTSVLEHSIRLRNPYVDPMSLIQVELLRRKRAATAAGQPVPAELDRAITATINGISAGLRNTG